VADASFHPVTEGDLPLVAAWLREEHVQQWWKNPSAPDNDEAMFLPRIHGVEPTEMLIITWQGRDIGVIQRYRMSDHPDRKRSLARTGLTFRAAAGIDYMIGVPDLVGAGIGSAVVAAFTADVFARTPDTTSSSVSECSNCREAGAPPYRRLRASCRLSCSLAMLTLASWDHDVVRGCSLIGG